MEVGHACKALQGTILGSGKCGLPRSLGCPDMPVCAGSSSADGGAVSDSSVDESDGEQLAPMLNPLAHHRQGSSRPQDRSISGRGQELVLARKINSHWDAEPVRAACLHWTHCHLGKHAGRAYKQEDKHTLNLSWLRHLCTIKPLFTLSPQRVPEMHNLRPGMSSLQSALQDSQHCQGQPHCQHAAMARCCCYCRCCQDWCRPSPQRIAKPCCASRIGRSQSFRGVPSGRRNSRPGSPGRCDPVR